MYSDSLKILFIGNSFSVDTCEYLVHVAKSLNVKKIKLLNLYIGGCSINLHYTHLINDCKAYLGFFNEGEGFKEIENIGIKESILSDTWDFIAIQHGTNDGSRYTDINSYVNLVNLVNEIKKIANENVKIVFNMTWVGESYHSHPEIRFYKGDQLLIYNKIANLTKNYILPLKEIDYISPTGTAIQNARNKLNKELTRDGYHLSLDLGRYIASLTFFKTITNADINNINWSPSLINADKKIAILSVNEALSNPFEITKKH